MKEKMDTTDFEKDQSNMIEYALGEWYEDNSNISITHSSDVEDKDAVIKEQRRLVGELRSILKVPEGHSIVIHAKKIMEKENIFHKAYPEWGVGGFSMPAESLPQKPDVVNAPPHYTQSSIECIEAIEASMTRFGFDAYLKGNILKYLWRFEDKNGLEDLKKAEWYLKKLITSVEKDV